jgi:hypothetical protein
MELSKSFGIDPGAEWVRRHNAEARRVLDAWKADRPVRVPLLGEDSFIQHGLYAGETGLDYRRYYADPDEMLRVQLESARRRREVPIADLVLGEAPESWPVTVDFWPVPGPGWVGCEVLFRRDTVPAHRSLALERGEAEARAMPDPRTGGLLATIGRFHEAIRRRAEGGLQFLGRPVGPVRPGVDHAGVFAMALDVRGPAILTDLYDGPDFARRFLLRMAEWCDALETAWRGPGLERGYFRNTDHGIDMLSAEMYERFLLPVIVEMNRRRGTPMPSGLHHCGRGAHLFGVVRRHCPLQRLDDLTFPLLDIAKVRRDVGPDVWIKVCIEDSIVRFGPAERVRRTVQDLMRSGAKGRGRLALTVGDMLAGTPLEHRLALYESVREFGGY